MIALVLVRALAAATPSPAPATIPPADITSPGIVGFAFTFGLALVCVLLFLSLTKQLRKVNHRAALQAAEDEADGMPDDPDDGPDGRSDGGPEASR
ncbi:MAG TPA: hypothetical protein VMV41_03965 [Cellulomonadaceae bacterium]|nr:hypothetical protein [Cellulomonadaceae bacterium]